MSDFLDFPVYDIPNSTPGKLIFGETDSIITILVPQNKYNSETSDFLKKIIKAININFESECKIREFENEELISIPQILKQDKSKYILSFGIEISQFHTNANLKINHWNNFEEFSLIITLGFSEIMNNVNIKKIFWIELQKILNEK